MPRQPVWETSEIVSPKHALVTVAEEGFERLLVAPTDAEREKVFARLREAGMSVRQADEIASFYFALMLEALTIGALLGHAMALTGLAFESYADWLDAAIDKAGLTDSGDHMVVFEARYWGKAS